MRSFVSSAPRLYQQAAGIGAQRCKMAALIDFSERPFVISSTQTQLLTLFWFNHLQVYTDPGSGLFFVQVAAAGLVSVLFRFRRALLVVVRRLRGSDSDS